ncbi:MAG: ABC transporter permease, partial [Candidatus Hodarchaeota archaeon]
VKPQPPHDGFIPDIPPVHVEVEGEEATGLTRRFTDFQIFWGFVNVIFGFVFMGVVHIIIYNDLGNMMEILGAIAMGVIPAIVIGTLLINVGVAARELETWSFQWVLYGNALVILLFILAGNIMPYVAIGNLVCIILLFTPEVREQWYELYKEDMVPRMKETRYTLYLIRRSPLVVVGIIIIAAYIFIAIFVPYFAPYGPTERNWYETLEEPSPTHLWGTDQNGGDVFSMVMWATRIDLRIAISVVAVALVLGSFIGASAGYFGGAVDEVVMRVTDVFFAFPGLILAMAIVAALGARNLDNISVALMLVWWPTYARLVRGQVLLEREKLYVEAARSVGASDSRILVFHILPNTIQPVIVQATLDMGGVLLTAAGLSFIGFGAEAGTAEWGLMISQGQQHFQNYWVTFYPGMAILMCALAFNLVGDGVRDILDPKLRRR